MGCCAAHGVTNDWLTALSELTHQRTNFQTLGSQDVTLFAIGIVDQRNAAVTVWIVFNGLNQTFDVKLVALEVDDAVEATVTTATMANGDTTLVVTARGFLSTSVRLFLWTMLGDFFKVRNRRVTGTIRESASAYAIPCLHSSMLSPSAKGDVWPFSSQRCSQRQDAYDGGFTKAVHGVDLGNLYLEHAFNSFFDFEFCLPMDAPERCSSRWAFCR